MRPRYDSLQGGLVLVLAAALLVLFGVPRAPLSAASMALFVLAGLFDVAAGFRPEGRVAGVRIDFVALRGLGTCCLALAILANTASPPGESVPFGLVMAGAGASLGAIGVATLLRRPAAVPELRGA